MKALIRPMEEKDLDVVVQMEKEIFIDAWSRVSFQTELQDKDYSYPMILEADEEIAGYAIVWSFFKEVHIANFAIHPSFRRKGLGKYLLEYILKKFNDAEFAFLEVRRSNLAAIKLYRSFDFKTIGIRKRYYRDGEDALVMVKDLRK